MKKLILSVMALLSISCAYSQIDVTTNNKFFDNWYGGVLVGTTHSTYHKAMRPSVGLELGKQITPSLGVSVQGITGINSSFGNNAFDDFSLTLNGKLNFMNLFGGYKGNPRLFEIEGVFGIGMLHEFYPSNYRSDNNLLTSRVGSSFNFNIGKEKQWTLSLRPGCVFNIEGKEKNAIDPSPRFELMAGVTYHFKGKSGKRHHSVMRAYDQTHVDKLNDEINNMRKRNGELENMNDEVKKQNKELTSALNDCKSAAKNIKDNAFDMSMEPVVSFRQGKDMIDVNQLSNIENIANYMKKYNDIKLEVKGYASPEGNEKFNQKLSQRRANNIKEILVNKYGIEAERITAKGMGVGNKFSKPEMNRAIIATFYK